MSPPFDRRHVWNERYATRERWGGLDPAAPLRIAVEGVRPGLALDLASGAGRNAIFLASLGWRVVAVEWAEAGVELMMEEARRRGLEDLVEPHVADLESRPRGFAIEPDRYDLVCDFFFLDRTLFDEMRAGVRPGGRFASAIHLAGKPETRNHAFLLAPRELRSIVDAWGWRVLHDEEGEAAEVVAVRE